MSIEVRSLLKVYGEQKAVNNISFKVDNGEIVGFLGPNGAGKSTTMKIITGYLQQTAGEAYVCGINVAENPLEIKKEHNLSSFFLWDYNEVAFAASSVISNRCKFNPAAEKAFLALS